MQALCIAFMNNYALRQARKYKIYLNKVANSIVHKSNSMKISFIIKYEFE